MRKQKVLMMNSVPMSLSEIQMAPAMLAAYVKNRGHSFQFEDVNLGLYDICGRKIGLYSDKAEFLQSHNNLYITDLYIDRWQQYLVNCLSGMDLLLLNVFSMFSQVPSMRIINLCRGHFPDLKIVVGGIGSHKKILSGRNEYNQGWIDQQFADHSTEIFGDLLLKNSYIDDWQHTVGMEVLDKWLPKLPVLATGPTIDFGDYRIDSYEWVNGRRRMPMLGSHGCVRQCSFCDVINHFPRYSFVEADTLVKQIVDAYQQTGINSVQFMDSLVNGSMTNFLRLLQNLVQAKEKNWLPKDFSWSGTYICRPPSALLDQIHPLLSASGADNLVIGVETGSDRVRFEMEKKFTNADLMYELDAFGRHNVKANLLFFPSWPTETLEDFEKTLDLFTSLSTYAQIGVIESVSLGSAGFALLDNTPIDQNRDSIGLTPGPRTWLWRCASNPTLDWWETVRRRMLMSEWCQHHGIALHEDNRFLEILLFYLREYRDIIEDYAGRAPKNLLYFDSILGDAQNVHSLKFTVVNAGSDAVRVDVGNSDTLEQFICQPGLTQIRWNFKKIYAKVLKFVVSIRFPESHVIAWRQHANGDYYNPTGVHLDDIFLDDKNITHWGWNQMVQQHIVTPENLPRDYAQHINRRCVTQDTDLEWAVPAQCGLHKHLLGCTQPATYQHKKQLELNLLHSLELFT